MIDNVGNQKSRKGIEHADLGGPFDRVCLSRSCGPDADAGHVEADDKDEGQSLRLGKVGGQDLEDPRRGDARGLSAEGGTGP